MRASSREVHDFIAASVMSYRWLPDMQKQAEALQQERISIAQFSAATEVSNLQIPVYKKGSDRDKRSRA